jgi:hypothetical protein
LAGQGGQQSRLRPNVIVVVQQELDATSAPSLAKDLVSGSTPLEPVPDVDSEFATEAGKLHRHHVNVLGRLRVTFHTVTIFTIVAVRLCSYRNRKQTK